MVWVQFELLCKCDPHTFCYLQARPSRDNRAGWQLLRSEASRERGCCAIWWLFIFGCELVRLVCLVVDLIADSHSRAVGAVPALRWDNSGGERMHIARLISVTVGTRTQLSRLQIQKAGRIMGRL